jgi:two-component system, response regulator PdtaR
MPVSQKIIRSLRETKVAVIHPQDEDGQNLSLQLRRIGCRLTSIWPPPRRMPSEVDAIFFLADPDQATALDWLEDERSCALIAVIAYENPLILETIASATIHGVIAKPIRTFGVLACLVTALSLYKYETTLISRIAKLDETLKTRRIVEKASRILAGGRGITEDDAYSVLRREAMNKQITLYEMATSIINAGSLLSKPE